MTGEDPNLGGFIAFILSRSKPVYCPERERDVTSSSRVCSKDNSVGINWSENSPGLSFLTYSARTFRDTQ